jgi:succinate dehydrogenase / fumarate reductase flavoprotein subunit
MKQPEIDTNQVEYAIESNLKPLKRENGENPGRVYDELRDMMQAKVGIIRTESDLQSALTDLEDFRKRVENTSSGSSMTYNSGWHQALDLQNMVDISSACTLAALTRTESRGGHTRDDFPEPDTGMWSHTTNVVWKEGAEIKIRQEELSQPPEELEELLDRSKKEA